MNRRFGPSVKSEVRTFLVVLLAALALTALCLWGDRL